MLFYRDGGRSYLRIVLAATAVLDALTLDCWLGSAVVTGSNSIEDIFRVHNTESRDGAQQAARSAAGGPERGGKFSSIMSGSQIAIERDGDGA